MVLKEKETYYTTRNGIPVVVEIVKNDPKFPLLKIVQSDSEDLLGQYYTIQECNFDKLQPFVCNIFKIGQTVISNQGNRFMVTGYEASSNRIVVRSLKNDSDRVRYSYAYNEMTVIDDYVVSIGKTYKINELHYAICATHPYITNQIMFVITRDGELGKTLICPCINANDERSKYVNKQKALLSVGITKIEEVKE